MLRTTVSKLRHVCALAYFVPRLLRGNLRYIPGRFEKLSINVQRRVDKSTDCSPEEESDYERCQRIIDRAFSPNPPFTEYIPETNAKAKQSLMNLVTPEMPSRPESQCEKCQKIIDEIFGENTNAEDKKKDIVDPVCIPVTELQATTAKENEETLAQKVEIINETPLVEAPAKSKLEGFNLTPKVLGNRRKRRANERVQILNFSIDKGRRKSSKKDNTFDELAKRCLDSPSGQIDERILKEMEKLGVPPSSRKSSRRTAHDAGIIQPEIMRRPRRPVEKTELDFLSRMRRLGELERINEALPPPFELISVKNSTIDLPTNCDAEDHKLYVERIQPYYLTDQINFKSEDSEEFISTKVDRKDENPPQQLLGQMTAAVMSNEAEMMTGKTDDNMKADESEEIEHLIIRQERLRNINDTNSNLSDDRTKTSDYENSPVGPGVVIRNSTDYDISFLKSNEKEAGDMNVPREKIAPTNFLSDFVDPHEISPQPEPSGFMKEYKEIETIRNLLQTRLEHLTNHSVKSRQFNEHTVELPRHPAPNIDTESSYQQEIEVLKVERLKPYYLKEDPNIISKETSPHTEPGILIRGYNENKSEQNIDNTDAIHIGYSPNQKLITAHQLLEQISLISRETELGATDDYNEIENTKPERATPFQTNSQLLENVGVVPKDITTPPEKLNLLPHDNIQNIITNNSNTYQNVMDPYNRDARENDPDDYEYVNLVERQDGGVKYSHNTLLTSSELSRRALTEDESDEPVIAVEMGRIESAADQEQLRDSNVLASSLQNESGNEQLTDANLLVSALKREPVLQESNIPKTVEQETFVNPLIDKGAVAHVAAENMNTDTSFNTIPKEHPPKPLKLSEMLKRVRERNQIELCKEFMNVKVQCTQVEPVVGECGKKKPPCPPPTPTCPPPPKPPCPPKEPPCPHPCKPKCPPTCPPAPCGEPKQKCPPAKKSPCEKFTKTKCSSVEIQDALTLLLYLGPQLHIPRKALLPIIACALNLNTSLKNATAEAMEQMCTKVQELCNIVLISSLTEDIDVMNSVVLGIDNTHYARTYDPWIPIPSWPIPVKEEKKRFVCPKEGCKVIPPKLNAPCPGINPCKDLPGRNKFTTIDYILYKFDKKIEHYFEEK